MHWICAKNFWALHYVVIKMNDGLQFYLMAKLLALRKYNRPNNGLYATAYGYAIRNNKGEQASLLQLFGPYIIT